MIFDFNIHHCIFKIQSHNNGLTNLYKITINKHTGRIIEYLTIDNYLSIESARRARDKYLARYKERFLQWQMEKILLADI